MTDETAGKDAAIRQLSWATYCVADDGRNRYPRDDMWLTDGYGDFVRHYLRAMAAAPELAPADQSHILRSDSVVSRADYQRDRIVYRTFDERATEILRLRARPIRVVARGKSERVLPESSGDAEGWSWQPLERGGVLRVRHSSPDVTIHLAGGN